MIREQIEELETLAAGGAINIKLTPSGKFHNYDPVKENAVKIGDLITKLEKEEERAKKTIVFVTEAINTLSNEIEHAVMTLRYIKCMKWEEVAEELDYSEIRTFEIHKSALENIKIHSKT